MSGDATESRPKGRFGLRRWAESLRGEGMTLGDSLLAYADAWDADVAAMSSAVSETATPHVALGDLKEAEEKVWECTGTAFLAGEKCNPDDRQVVYKKLCAVGNLIASAREELSTPSAREPTKVDDILIRLGELEAERKRLLSKLPGVTEGTV